MELSVVLPQYTTPVHRLSRRERRKRAERREASYSMRAVPVVSRRWVTSLLGAAAIALAVWAALPARASSSTRDGGFVIPCRYSHTLKDDPIVDPGRPGASHSHDFFGNTSTNARSTYASMVTAGTTCALHDDTAGYWVPTPQFEGR